MPAGGGRGARGADVAAIKGDFDNGATVRALTLADIAVNVEIARLALLNSTSRRPSPSRSCLRATASDCVVEGCYRQALSRA